MISDYLLEQQQVICKALSAPDQMPFMVDAWEANHGIGKSAILAGQTHIEKAAVNVSVVSGDALPKAATQNRTDLVDVPFKVCGLSLIVHPHNPYVPTTHFNVRFFQTTPATGDPVWWFGGGFDLTPYYPFTEDCVHWHKIAKQTCAPFGRDIYPKYKKACDAYFYLKHRQENRGIGGLFFDDVNVWGFEACFEFMKKNVQGFLAGYIPILEKRKDHPFSEKEKDFQLYRRGRYAEFNLLYDRGTRFGLEFGGRIESILASMPPMAKWIYDYQPEPGSPESKLTEYYLKPQEWLKLTEKHPKKLTPA